MKNKNKIGVLVILGGIALLGYSWFKKNKPTVASSQLKGLEELSNYYKTGTGGQEETYIKGTAYTIPKVEGISFAQVDFSTITPKQIEDIKKTIGTVNDPIKVITDQISENMKNADFTNLDLGIKPDFSKLNKTFI